jgi:hypothetical protein
VSRTRAFAAFVSLAGLAAAARADDSLVADIDALKFAAPKGKVGKAVKFSLEKHSRSASALRAGFPHPIASRPPHAPQTFRFDRRFSLRAAQPIGDGRATRGRARSPRAAGFGA